MNRRAFLAAGTATGLAGLPAGAQLSLPTVPKVIYVGGKDCDPCKRWKDANLKDWLASREFKKVRWYEIDPPSLLMAYIPQYWPDELKPVLEQLPRKMGTPRFLVVVDDKVVANHFGGRSWPNVLGDVKKHIA